ncbi:MAG: hypothetical protein ACM3YE_04555 [Bacteroidota bacterium]
MAKKVYRKKLAPNQRLASPALDIWQMPPYIVARFGGELTQVMLEAAQKYITEKCITEIRKDFNKEITADQTLS